MKKKTKNYLKRIIALLLVLMMSVSLLSGCGKTDVADDSPVPGITTEEIADIITEEIQNYTEETHSDTDSIIEQGEEVVISDDWHDYVGDIDTFVYGLLVNEYNNVYDVFNAMIELPDGSDIYGFAYTDYDTYFESDDGIGYFPAGFIGLIGEESIPSVYANEGLEIVDLDYDDEDCRFVYAYDCSDFTEHCVIWGQYLKYGVKAGVITYACTEFSKEKCDESIGALYSYDDGKYLYDPEVGDYVRVTGSSISESIDYDELQTKIDDILNNQDQYFSNVDIEESAYLAQEAFESYLLSMQEEKFMGYDVKELIKISSELDPMECIQLTPDGMLIIDATETLPENSPSDFTKWMTGICCGLVVVGCIALDIFVPALAPLSGAIMSAAIEVFSEVVMQNNQIKNVNWAKVGVAAVSGALIAWACPAAAASTTTKAVSILGKTFSKGATTTISKICGYAVLAFSNAIVAGSTNAAFAYLDGKSSDSIYDAFLMGAAIGGAMTIAASIAAEAGSVAMKALKNAHPNNWLSNLGDKASTFIGNHQVPLKNTKLEEVLVPKSIHQAAESAWEELYAAEKPLYVKRVNQLPSDNNSDGLKLVDNNGNKISKSDVYSNKGNCKIDLSECNDKDVINAINAKGGGEYSYLDVENGVVDMSKFSEGKFVPRDGISSNRDLNMTNFYNDLAENNNKIPESIMSQMKEANIDTSSSTQIKKFIKTKWTLHETESGYVEFVDKYVHGVVGHYGGVGRAEALNKILMVETYFKEIYSTSAISVTGTLIP